MPEERREPPLPSPEECRAIDAIFDLLESNPRRAMELFTSASPRIQQLTSELLPSEGIIQKEPQIQIDLIMTYIIAIVTKNELAKERVRRNCNLQTKEKLDELNQPITEQPL
jgi:hypothetical protein